MDKELKQTKLVSIEWKFFNKLLDDSKRLEALEAAGVGDWEGYGEAMTFLYGDED